MYLIYQDLFVDFTKCCKNLKDLCSKFERSQQSKLDRGCSEAKSVNFKSQPQTLLKELFQLKPSENCCHCPLCILDLNSSCYSYTNSLKCQEGCTCNKSAQKVPPKKCKKGAKYSSNKIMRTFKSAQKSTKKSAFTNKSAQKSTLKSTFGSSAPI